MKFVLILMLAIPAFGQIDYSDKTEDQTPFRKVFNAETQADKSAILGTLTEDERHEVWRQNMLWAKQSLSLTSEQEDFLDRFVNSFPITGEQKRDFENEALAILPKNKAEIIFAIGPFTRTCGHVKARFLVPTCWCSIGSSFNMSCDDTCAGMGSGCNRTEQDCGFAYMWPCDGGCNDGQPHNN